jgi:hypothetical protein
VEEKEPIVDKVESVKDAQGFLIIDGSLKVCVIQLLLCIECHLRVGGNIS